MRDGPDSAPDSSIAIITDDNAEGMETSRKLMTKEEAESDSRLRQVRERYQVHQTFWQEIFNDAIEDDKFVAGEQWPDDIRRDREEDGRPVLTYNLLPAFVRQITNKIREDRQTIKVVPVDSQIGSSPQIPNVSGTKDYSLADVYSGIIKNIEHTSRADQAYETAAKHAVEHGFGFFYLMNEWSKIDPFVQDLVIHRVKNSYTVMLDPDAQEADFRDGQDAFMSTRMKKTTFKQRYPRRANE